jgi:hypothetical protein
VTLYMVTPYCLVINFEEIPSCFVLNVFLWLPSIIKWSKLGSYLHNTNIWGNFLSTFGHLTPLVTIYRVTPYWLAIHFEEIQSCFVLNVLLWLHSIIKWSKLGSYLHKTNIWGNFWSKFGYLTHRGDHI